MVAVAPSPALQLTTPPTAPSLVHSSLPPRPNFNQFETAADAMGLRAPSVTGESVTSSAVIGASGSNHDWVANRRAIRMANMSAAEMLKAEMGLMPVKPSDAKTTSSPNSSTAPSVPALSTPSIEFGSNTFDDAIPGLMSSEVTVTKQTIVTEPSVITPVVQNGDGASAAAVTAIFDDVLVNNNSGMETDGNPASLSLKRKLDDVEVEDADADADADADGVTDEDDEEAVAETSVAPVRKVNPDGTVDQEDTVKCDDLL